MPTHIERQKPKPEPSVEEQVTEEQRLYVEALRNAKEGLRSAEALLREASRRARRAGKDDAHVRLTGLVYDTETIVEKVSQL